MMPLIAAPVTPLIGGVAGYIRYIHSFLDGFFEDFLDDLFEDFLDDVLDNFLDDLLDDFLNDLLDGFLDDLLDDFLDDFLPISFIILFIICSLLLPGLTSSSNIT